MAISRARLMLGSRLSSLPDPAHPDAAADVWPQWQRIWRQFPQQWGALCRRLLQSAGEASRLDLPVPPLAPTDRDSDGEWLCQQCGAEFDTRAKLKQHMAGKHRTRQPGFAQIPSSICPFCRCDFRTRYRCLVHFGPKGSQLCAGQLASLPPLSADELAAAIHSDAVQRRQRAQHGAWNSSGPPALKPQ